MRGFFTRGRSKFYDGTVYRFAVVPRDTDRRWIVDVAERLTVEPGDPPAGDVAATITGTAVELYLALWNRGADVAVTGRSEILERWAATQRVGWS